jgi:hypothetical protein
MALLTSTTVIFLAALLHTPAHKHGRRGASTSNSDEEIKEVIRKDATRVRKLMHEVTNEKFPVLFSSPTPGTTPDKAKKISVAC